MKKPMKQLLAVVIVMGASGVASADAPRTLANQRPACGNTMGKGGPDSECQWQEEMWDRRQGLARAQHELRQLEALVGVPRTLATGRPACGNTMGKQPEREETPQERVSEAARTVGVWRQSLERTEREYKQWKAAQAKRIAAR